MDDATDAELLARASKDPEAFGLLFDRYAESVFGRIRREGVPAGDARDLLAETFAQAWLHRRRFRDPGDGSAHPWLAGIARNLARNYFRTAAVDARARRRLKIELSPAEPDEIVLAADARDGHTARALLDRIDERSRRAVELRVIDGLDYREIAARLGCTSDTARKRVSLALRAMRIAWEEKT